MNDVRGEALRAFGLSKSKKLRAFHFCAEFHEEGGIATVLSGVVTTDVDPFSAEFYSRLVDGVAAKFDPPRPPKGVIIRTISLLASK